MSAAGKGKGILHELEEHRTGFSLWFISLFTVLFVLLAVFDVLPDPTLHWQKQHGGAPVAEQSTTTQSSTAPVFYGEQPVRIVIDSLGIDAVIANPPSTDVDVLDEALLNGAVRYPTSGLLGINGTVLLFGHSSYLPVVRNQAFKTFDGIQNLKTGAEISVYSGSKEYRYRVTGVRTANTTDEDTATINLPNDAQHLTLVTCDSFKTKSDRFVVTADFVGTYSLVN